MARTNPRRELVRMIMEYTDAPDVFIEAASYWVVSTLIGDKIVVGRTRGTIGRHGHPNLWVMISGMPGVTRKSTVLGVAKYVVTEALVKYYTTVLSMGSDDAREAVDSMVIETGSPEGIVDHIIETRGALAEPKYMLVSEEFGEVLIGMQRTGYMDRLPTLLSRLYDGGGYVWHGAKKKRYVPHGLYVTALVAFQDPRYFMSQFFFVQGLMRRFLLVYATEEDKTRYYDPISEAADIVADAIKRHAEEVLAEVAARYTGGGVLALLRPEAARRVNEYARRVSMGLRDEPNLYWKIHYQSYYDFALRMAVLDAAASGAPEEQEIIEGVPMRMIEVGEEHVSEAISFLENRVKARAREAIILATTKRGHVEYRQAEGVKSVVLGVVLESRNRCVSLPRLAAKTQMMHDDLVKVVSTLMVEGRLVLAIGQRSVYVCDSSRYNELAVAGYKVTRSPRVLESFVYNAVW